MAAVHARGWSSARRRSGSATFLTSGDVSGPNAKSWLSRTPLDLRLRRGPQSRREEEARIFIEPKAAAEAARSVLGIKDDELIRDMCGLLEDHRVKVMTPKLASDGFFGLSIAGADGGPAVVVNTWDRISVERWIFTAAHELGHLVLHLASYDVKETDENREQESEADVFAGYFLMPEKTFAAELTDSRGLPLVDRVFKLKRSFRVSPPPARSKSGDLSIRSAGGPDGCPAPGSNRGAAHLHTRTRAHGGDCVAGFRMA